jgi:choline dehydrogenase-like flavoprotein
MTFTPSTYANFVSEDTAARERLFLEYIGWREDFDIIIVGSGIGGGVLADDLADRLGSQKRILVLEAGSFLSPPMSTTSPASPTAAWQNTSAATRFGKPETAARRTTLEKSHS